MSYEHPGAGHIGFRLAHELEGILTGIRADGVIHQAETERLRRWMDVNQPYVHLRPFSELSLHAARALADGVLTMDECDDLIFVTQKLTTVNPYFDALRGGVQILLGLLAGMVADQTVPPEELRKLSDWSDDWSHLQGLWPFDEAVAITTALLNKQAQPAESFAYIRAMVDQFPLAGEYEGSWAAPTISGICAVAPTVTFAEKRFVFTGESARGPRSELEIQVVDRGGKATKSIGPRTNYLVVCDEGSPCWAFSCYGRKVEKAYNLRREGHPIVIVHEIDFWDATR